MAWSTAPTFVAGNGLTAAQLNILGGDLNVLGGGWVADARASTTIWTGATVSPTLGNGTLASRIRTVGKTINWIVQITMGSTTTFGTGAWQLVLPTASLLSGQPFDAVIRDASATKSYPSIAELIPASTTTATLRILNTTAGNEFLSVDSSGTRPITWATGDMLTAEFLFEAA